MADPGYAKKIKTAGRSFYYVAVDGTDTVDSAAFGKAIEEFGFLNLYTQMLAKNPENKDQARLQDPNHPYLPIYRVKEAGSKGVANKDGVAVVCPCGLSSHGDETWWTNASAQLGQSTSLMKYLILNPNVVLRSDGKMAIVANKSVASTDTVFKCDLLTLSSHGWLGGFMAGNSGYMWTIIGAVAADTKLKFQGPVWLILAQCSTVCTATWPSWVRVMARSDPPVRGILAYEEVAPAADRAAGLARQFFNNLKKSNKGKPTTFIEAWGAVNDAAGRSWAAIVHEDAMDDSLVSFPDQKPIDVTDALTRGAYRGWSQTKDEKKKAEPIKVVDPPFKLSLDQVNPGLSINETNLNSASLLARTSVDDSGVTHPGARPGLGWQVSLEPPAGSSGAIVEATIEWIHIRKTKDRFDSRKIFEKVTIPSNVKQTYTFKAKGADKKSLYTFKIDKADKVTLLIVTFEALEGKFAATTYGDENYKGDDRLVAHHSYLWLRAGLKMDDGTVLGPTDFTTRGLVYYGGSTGDGEGRI